MTVLCAYAITRGSPDLGDIGVEPPPRLLAHRDLRLVVSEVEPDRFTHVADDTDNRVVDLARVHDAVVRGVFRTEPVLPLRFGTVVADDAAALRLLRGAYDTAVACLDRVAGHSEWGIRLRLAVPPESPEPPGLSGTDYLMRRRARRTEAEDARRRATTSARSLREALSRHAKEVVSRAELNTAYLVAFGNEAAFHDELARRTAALGGVTAEVTGPWPPYSFTDVEIGVCADA